MPRLPPPHLRLARPEDLDLLAEIERRSFPDPWSRAMVAGEMGRGDALQLLAFTSRVAATPPSGYAAFRLLGRESELLRLAVLPEARRQGVARALVEKGLVRLAREGVRSCFLEVRESNLPARLLYEGMGFARTGQRPRYYRDGDDAVIYRVGLDAAGVPV